MVFEGERLISCLLAVNILAIPPKHSSFSNCSCLQRPSRNQYFPHLFPYLPEFKLISSKCAWISFIWTILNWNVSLLFAEHTPPTHARPSVHTPCLFPWVWKIRWPCLTVNTTTHTQCLYRKRFSILTIPVLRSSQVCSRLNPGLALWAFTASRACEANWSWSTEALGISRQLTSFFLVILLLSFIQGILFTFCCRTDSTHTAEPCVTMTLLITLV